MLQVIVSFGTRTYASLGLYLKGRVRPLNICNIEPHIMAECPKLDIVVSTYATEKSRND